VSREDRRGTRFGDIQQDFSVQSEAKKIVLDIDSHNQLVGFLNRKSDAVIFSTGNGPGQHVTRNALQLEKVSIRGIMYAGTDSLPRDSYIIFQKKKETRPGQIVRIFSHTHTRSDGTIVASHYLVVSPFSTLNSADSNRLDKFRKFGFAGGFLCHNNRRQSEVVEASDVVCQFAKTPMNVGGMDLIHVLPLDRVCLVINLLVLRY
jgi:hypothetical protein